MLNVFGAEELRIQLSNGRIITLKDLVMDYERLLKEEVSKKEVISEPKDDKSTAAELKVGEWFRIDREVIKQRLTINCQ